MATINNFVAQVSYQVLQGTTMFVGAEVDTDASHSLSVSASGPIANTNAQWATTLFNAIKTAFSQQYGDVFGTSPTYKIFGWPFSSTG